MKSDHDLHFEKKVFPWDFGWCILMEMRVLNKNMQSISWYLLRGGNARPKTGLILCGELSGDLAMTIRIYYYSNWMCE